MENRSQDWIDQMTLKVKDVFDVFDKDKTETVGREEIGTILRGLDIYPPERILQTEIIPSLVDDENPGIINFQKLKKKALQLLADKQWQPDSSDVILQAFRTLDSQNKGYISSEVMETYLVNNELPFQPNELNTFLNLVKEPQTGNIYYEDYATLFPKDM